jgi:hypothetical protein
MKRTTLCLLAGAVAYAIPAVALAGDWLDGFETYDCEADICAADGTGGWVSWDGSDSSTNGRVSCSPDHPVLTGEKSLRGLGGGATADDLVYTYSFINTGYWAYTAWMYIPSGAYNGQTHYFILLNQWGPNGAGANWSTQLRCDPQSGTINSEFEEVSRPLVLDQWVELKVLINLFTPEQDPLGGDMQNVFYNGNLLTSKSWTDGVSGGGTLSIQAVDLWFNDVTVEYVYYDDMSLIGLPPTGACCYDNGDCDDGLEADSCATGGGRFQGIGSFCDAVECPVYGNCGWLLTGPTQFAYTTVGQGDDCDWVSGSEDEQFEITIPYDGWWTFSLCEGTDWDTVITLGAECCGFDWNNDGVPDFDDNSCPAGFQSLLVYETLPAGTYFLNLEDVNGTSGGAYRLIIDTPCILDCPDGAYVEAEPCGSDTNGGCNMDVPTFEPIELDVPVCGDAWFDGSSRDTDWYEIVLGAEHSYPLDLTFSGTSEFQAAIGMVQYQEGTEGSGDCADNTGYISPFTQIESCQEADVEVTIPNAGTYWFFVAPDFGGPDVILCGEEDGYENDYVVVLTASGAPCPWDFDGNGVVNTGDLLFLLGAWGTPAGDVNGDGTTNTADLLDLLGNWGDCP